MNIDQVNANGLALGAIRSLLGMLENHPDTSRRGPAKLLRVMAADLMDRQPPMFGAPDPLRGQAMLHLVLQALAEYARRCDYESWIECELAQHGRDHQLASDQAQRLQHARQDPALQSMLVHLAKSKPLG